MSKFALIAALAVLPLGACSYSGESSFLGYRSSTSFATPGAAPAGYYAQPPAPAAAPGYYAPAPGYTEAPAYAPAYGPVYAPAPVYYGPTLGLSFGRWWGRRRW